MGLLTFFNYYGGKWRIAPRYPAPSHKTIIEPFAGAAGYSLRHHKHDVILIDKDPNIVSIWQWLIAASPEDVMALPIGIDSTEGLPDGAKQLVGFCFNAGAAAPCSTPSKWAKSKPQGGEYWSEKRRKRIADQVDQIKHWRIIHGTYSDAPDIEATWFIDPPYNNKAGGHYVCGASGIDYAQLGSWCQSRRGQAIVCENEGADWLPFTHFHNAHATPGSHRERKRSVEVVWTSGHD